MVEKDNNDIIIQKIALHITSTMKNTLITLVKFKPQTINKVYYQASSRGYPIKMKKKNNELILQKMGEDIVEQIQNIDTTEIFVFIKGVGPGRTNLINYLLENLIMN